MLAEAGMEINEPVQVETGNVAVVVSTTRMTVLVKVNVVPIVESCAPTP